MARERCAAARRARQWHRRRALARRAALQAREAHELCGRDLACVALVLLAHVLCEAHVGEAVAEHCRWLGAQKATQQRGAHGKLEDLAAAKPQRRAAPRDAQVDLSARNDTMRALLYRVGVDGEGECVLVRRGRGTRTADERGAARVPEVVVIGEE